MRHALGWEVSAIFSVVAVCCLGARADDTSRLLLREDTLPRAAAPAGMPALETAFERRVNTIDPLGSVVGPNEPRWEQPELFAGVPAATQVTTGDFLGLSPLAAGYTADGEQLWVLERFGFNAVNKTEIWIGEPTGEIDNPPPGSRVLSWDRPDFFDGQIPFVELRIEAAQVFQGAIVLAGQLDVTADITQPGAWRTGRSTAVLVGQIQPDGTISRDDFELVYCDAELGLNTTADRVRHWSMSHAYVPTREPHPSEVWFTFADYRPGTISQGGMWLAIRATRTAPDQPWTFGTPCELLRIERDGYPDKRIRHSHMAALAWDTTSGRMTALMFAGDGAKHNAVFAMPIEDPSRYDEASATYSLPWWPGGPFSLSFGHTPDPRWLGVVDAPPPSSAWGLCNFAYHGATQGVPNPDSPSRLAFQPVGAAPGLTPNTLILGTDNHDGPGILHLDIEEAPAEEGAIFTVQHLQLGNSGYGETDGYGYINFRIATTTPENPREYVATIRQNNVSPTWFIPHTIYGLPHEGRIVWGKIASINKNNAFAYGRSVYHAPEPPNFTGLARLDLAEPIVGRPQRIGHGGGNVLAFEAAEELLASVVNPSTAEQITGAALDALPPRPFRGPVYRVKRPGTDGTKTIVTRLRPAPGTFTLPDGGIAARVWTLAQTDGEPHGSPIRVELGLEGDSGNTFLRFGEVTSFSADRWMPVDVYGTTDDPGPVLPFFRVLAVQNAITTEHTVADSYIGIDAIRLGLDAVGYPYPNAASGVEAAPSEARTVTGFGDAATGSLAVAAMIPWDGMDYGWRLRGLTGDRPLLTIVADPSNWLSIRWTDLGRVEAVVSEAGVETVITPPLLDTPIQRGDPFQIMFRWDAELLTIDCAWAGYSLRSVTLPRPAAIGPTSELRFGGSEADLSALTGVPLSVFGVGSWPAQLSDAQRDEQFHTLGYLRAPACLADLDGDGTLTIDDVLAYLNAFAAGEPQAQFALPELTLDIDDVLAFLSAFAAGCD